MLEQDHTTQIESLQNEVMRLHKSEPVRLPMGREIGFSHFTRMQRVYEAGDPNFLADKNPITVLNIGCGIDSDASALLSFFSGGNRCPEVGERPLNYIGVDSDTTLPRQWKISSRIKETVAQAPDNITVQHICNLDQDKMEMRQLNNIPEIPPIIDAVLAFSPLADRHYYPVIIESLEKLKIGGLLTLNILVAQTEQDLYRRVLNPFINDESLSTVSYTHLTLPTKA